MRSLISNPPYNMKWTVPPFAQLQPRFNDCELPPESNANYAFILTALDAVGKDGRAVFIMPCGMLTTDNKQEKAIRQYLVDHNFIDCIITCPDKMFESTSIPTCIIVFDKNKDTSRITMIDMRNTYETEIREQNGQYGGASHEKRTYKKEVKVFSEENMQKALSAISERRDEAGFCRSVCIGEVKSQDYNLLPTRYIENEAVDCRHREYADIIADLNRVIRQKNCLKLTMNETVAKSIGMYDLYLMCKASAESNDGINKSISFTGQKIEKENFLQLSKKKNEIKFENQSDTEISTILLSIMQMWKQHIMYLNLEENRYLAELRDAILPDLMSGKIDVRSDADGRIQPRGIPGTCDRSCNAGGEGL